MLIIPEYYILEVVNQLKIIGINNQLCILDDVMFVNGVLATVMNNFFFIDCHPSPTRINAILHGVRTLLPHANSMLLMSI